MAKQSALDKAIEALEAERAALDIAILKLKAQQPAGRVPIARNVEVRNE